MALPINFHKTFIPERRLISALLQYAADGKAGDYQDISAETGIPMGKSNGKVPAVIDYARGMGLIRLVSTRSAVKTPTLTEFGRIVFLEDSLMGEPITQWLAHMNLCRPDIGASAWYHVFGKGRRVLGNTFSTAQLEGYLTNIFGAGKNRTGPLVRTYQDDAALGRTRAVSSNGKDITRNKAPTLNEYAMPYAAFVLSLMEALFADQQQVTIRDLNEKTAWLDTCLWGHTEVERAMTLLGRTTFIGLDKQMQPWILERKTKSQQVWSHIYDDLA